MKGMLEIATRNAKNNNAINRILGTSVGHSNKEKNGNAKNSIDINSIFR